METFFIVGAILIPSAVWLAAFSSQRRTIIMLMYENHRLKMQVMDLARENKKLKKEL